jgi:MFS family permease
MTDNGRLIRNPAAQVPPTWRTSALIVVLLLFCVFAVIDRSVIAMLVDPIRHSLGISDTQIALLMGIAYAAAYALGGLPMGYLVDKKPRKWILYFAVTFWGLAEAACGVPGGFAWLFMARMAVGLGEAPLHPSAHSIIADTVPKHRLATVMSIYSGGNLIGTGLALIIGGWIVNSLLHHGDIDLPLLGKVAPWQFAFILTGLPGMALALLILPFREPPRSHLLTESQGSWGELFAFLRLRWQVLLCLSVVFGGMNIVNGGLIKWQPAYLSRFYHLNPAEYGFALGIIDATSAVAGLIVSGWLVDRWYVRGRKDAHLLYYLWAIILTSPIVFYGLVTDNLTIYLASAVVAKSITVNFLGLAAAQVQLIAPPQLRGRLSGLFFMMIIALLGSTFGALIPALISDHVFHDEIRIGRAIAATLAIFAPLSVFAILWGRRYVREAVIAAESF